MGKRKISVLMTVVMLASLFVISDSNVNAEGNSNQGNEAAIWSVEEEIGKQVSKAYNEAYEFQDEALSRAYQLKVEALGEKYFPQYAKKAVPIMTRSSDGNLELGSVVYSETKNISDEEELSYIEYSSGRASLFYRKSWINGRSEPADSGGTKYTCTCMVTVNGCIGTVYAKDVVYTINFNSFDWIDDAGTCIDKYFAGVALLRKRMEDATPAMAEYGGQLTDVVFQSDIGISYQIRVGGNAARVYVDNTEI